jgi:hypothetical protein
MDLAYLSEGSWVFTPARTALDFSPVSFRSVILAIEFLFTEQTVFDFRSIVPERKRI